MIDGPRLPGITLRSTTNCSPAPSSSIYLPLSISLQPRPSATAERRRAAFAAGSRSAKGYGCHRRAPRVLVDAEESVL